MKITAIKQQVKNQGRYSIYIDDKYAFGLSEPALIDSGLRIRQEITKEELGSLKNTAKLDKGYSRVLNLLARRPRSVWEARDYLVRKSYEKDEIKIILNRLSNFGYLDDIVFARSWVESRRILKSTSQRKLALELKQKRISQEIIDKILAEDKENTDEREVMRELIERKKARYPDRLKLMQYLSRQGFSYDLIKEVLED